MVKMTNNFHLFFLSLFFILISQKVNSNAISTINRSQIDTVTANNSHIIRSALDSFFETTYRFQQLPQAKQLSHLAINDIIQDQEGFIWIATKDGLNRYDGNNIVVYRPSSNNNRFLSHFYINCLWLDNQGKLWVGTQNGLNRYNAKLDNFELFGFSGLFVTSIFEDSNHQLWIGTRNNGASLISADRTTIEPIQFNNNTSNSNALLVSKFTETPNHKILIATHRGLLIFNKELNQLEYTQIANKKDESLLHKYTTQLLSIDRERILVGTRSGLYLFDLTTGSYSELFTKIFNNRDITTINKIDTDNILVGTSNSGLFLINLIAQTYQSFHKSSSNKFAISNNQITSIFQSNDGLIWIGTAVGINILDISLQTFGHVQSTKNIENCLAGNIIYAILHDSNNVLWIGSFGQALHKIDFKKGTCEKITDINNSSTGTIPKKTSLKNVVSLFEDEHGDIWIGTLNDGIYRYHPQQDKYEFYHIISIVNSTEKIKLDVIKDISGNLMGKIWIATFLQGLIEFDLKKQLFSQHIPTKKGNSDSDDIFVKALNKVSIDNSGSLWVTTYAQGLWKYISKNGNFIQIQPKGKDTPLIPKRLYSIDIDKQNTIWIGSQGEGLFRYNPETEKTTRYSMEDGLLSNVIWKTIEDADGNIWIFTEKGLSRLSFPSEKIDTFLESDGLQADAFTPAGSFNEKHQILWTGGINGINHFNPKDIVKNNPSRKVIINDFELFYQSVKPKHLAPDSPLEQMINTTESIDLNYDQNVFAFSFSALEFLHPERISYQFKLEGYDQKWNEVSSDRRYSNYTNIDPGNYTFRVKASNIDGLWNGPETSIDISVATPWWQTPWVYASYVILTLLSIYFLVVYRTRALTKRSQELEKSVQIRTEELATEKDKVEQLLSKKNEEFANVSHEFRTPLTLILGPVAQMLRNHPSEQEIARLNIVQRNGYRLLRMVDQLLNLETFRIKAITQKSPQPTGKIIRLLTEAFADLAEEKNIQLSIKNIAEVNFEFTNDALEKIVLNLLSNAIKYSKAGDSISVETTRTSNNELSIQVVDTGIGIPADKLDTIFERYNRVLDENSEQVTGAGIGLALVKSLVEAHQGRIDIQSELGKGTQITVYLPIIGEVDDSQVSLHANAEIVAMELMGLTNQGASSSAEQNQTEQKQELEPSLQDHLLQVNQKTSVLVIEDNADMRNYIVSSIEDDYQILTARDGAEGLEIATAEVPDLIISDVMMPKMDGYETTHRLRSNEITNHIPIILLTARGDRESRLKGWQNKADEYLTKPFDVEELKIRLKNLLEIRNILKNRFGEIAFQPPKQGQGQKHQLVQEIDASSTEDNIGLQQEQFITKLNDILEPLYAEPSTTVAMIASEVAMSERQFFRKLKSILNITPSEYMRRYRLEKSKTILDEGHSIQYAAMEVGFGTQSHFGRCFKAQFGCSPKDYKSS